MISRASRVDEGRRPVGMRQYIIQNEPLSSRP